jgi:NAD-dependent deacetylase
MDFLDSVQVFTRDDDKRPEGWLRVPVRRATPRETSALSLDAAREIIHNAKRIAVLTGAGISAESGLPTFRGADGLWRGFRAEELATPEAFARNPRLVWDWYEWRREAVIRAHPNAAHRSLFEIELRAQQFTLITQNVDDLHERAGSRNVLHLHGEILLTRCTKCGRETRKRVASHDCSCGGLFRPGVVWYGEHLPEDAWAKAQEAARVCEVLLIVGTSGQVQPAASLVPIAKASGAKTIEVNLEASAVSGSMDFCLFGAAATVLPGLT